MPAGYTHYVFSEDVIAHLHDQTLKELLIKYIELFQIGTHGPDIFFFHHIYQPNDYVHKLGIQMHRHSAISFFEESQKRIDDDAKLAYMLGFVCHYILDSQMHHYVKKIMNETDMDHFEVEAEYDRILLKREHKTPIQAYIYPHVHINEHIVCVIQSFFPELSYIEVEESLRDLKRIDGILHAPGYLKRGMLYGLFHLTFHYKKLQGLVINYHHNKQMDQYYDLLDKIYNQALDEAVYYVEYYATHYQLHESLPDRFDHDYY